jgi:hypothetical protein
MNNYSFLLILLVANLCFGQKTFKSESLGFSMEQPENWIVAKNGETLENIKSQLKFDVETLNKLIDDNKGTIQIITLFKYPIESTAGIIPTIKVSLRKNTAVSFNVFKSGIEASFNGLKKVFPDFEYLTTPFKTKLSGNDCVKAVCKYTLKGKNKSEQVKIIVYAVLIKNQFYQITFMDSENEDNTDLYDKLAKTIAIF